MSSHKINVLYLSHSAQLYGAEQSLLQLLKGLDRDRFSPVVVLPQEGPLKQRIADLSIPIEIVPSIRGWLTRREGIMRLLHHIGLIPFLARSVWTVARLVHRYNIRLIHTNSLVLIDGALTARLSGIPHVWHAREMLVRESPHNFLFGPRSALSLVNHLADRIIAISNAVRLCFEQAGDASKIIVVHNAVDLPALDTLDAGDSIRRELDIPQGVPVVGEIANITPVKGYEDLVVAGAQVRQSIPNVRFMMVGGAPYASYKKRITMLINDYGLGDCFVFTGFRPDVPEIISTLDLLVLPSHYEPFGRALVEAMAAGKPVIGTNVGGIPEIIEDGVTGLLVPPGSPDDLAQAIITILQNPDMARRMGAAGCERAKARFSPERYATEIQKIYKELVGEGKQVRTVRGRDSKVRHAVNKE